MDEKQPLSHEIEEFKTDSDELNQVLDKYNLDEALEAEFNAIDKQFRDLEVHYQSLLNARRYLNAQTFQ